MKYDFRSLMENFVILGDFINANPYGTGLVNDTFAVSFHQGGTPVRYILQRVNHNVFKNPVALMENIYRVTTHLYQKMLVSGSKRVTRETLILIPTRDGKCYYQDEQKNTWRVYIFIEEAQTYDVLESEQQAYEAARTYGHFQRLLVDLPGPRLNETIPDFHTTTKRFEQFEKALDEDTANRADSAKKEIDFVLERKSMTHVLLDLFTSGEIPERITHNDTKINNVMLDDKTGKGVCVIDLDTVMPGLSLYDFGDMVRTAANRVGEEERDLSKVTVNLQMFEALVKGYLDSAGAFLNKTEKEYLAFSGKLITFEIGFRFLTDYLSGDVYFKVQRDKHNLDRARNQFKMVQDMENLEDRMRSIVKEYGT
jgi:hypothetical protein